MKANLGNKHQQMQKLTINISGGNNLEQFLIKVGGGGMHERVHPVRAF